MFVQFYAHLKNLSGFSYGEFVLYPIMLIWLKIAILRADPFFYLPSTDILEIFCLEHCIMEVNILAS